MRIKLVLALAEAIAVACEGQRVTWANCRRYVTRDFLTAFYITRDTIIHSTEWMRALSIAQIERRTRRFDGLAFAHVPDKERILKVYLRDFVSIKRVDEFPVL